MEELLSSDLVKLTPEESKQARHARYPFFKEIPDMCRSSYLFDEIPFDILCDPIDRNSLCGAHEVYYHDDKIDWGALEGWEVPSTRRNNDKGRICIGATENYPQCLEGYLFFIPPHDDSDEVGEESIYSESEEEEEEDDEFTESEDDDDDTQVTVDSSESDHNDEDDGINDNVAVINEHNGVAVVQVDVNVHFRDIDNEYNAANSDNESDDDNPNEEDNEMDVNNDEGEGLDDDEESFGSERSDFNDDSDADHDGEGEAESDDEISLTESELQERLSQQTERKWYKDCNFLHFDQRLFVLDNDYENTTWFVNAACHFGLVKHRRYDDDDAEDSTANDEEEAGGEAGNSVTLFIANESMAFTRGDKQQFVSLENRCNYGTEVGWNYECGPNASNTPRMDMLQRMKEYRGPTWISKLCPSNMTLPDDVSNLIGEYWRSGPPGPTPFLFVERGDMLLLARQEEILHDSDSYGATVTREHVVLARRAS